MRDVSVIVPIYNVENYLKECLDSIIEQNGVDFEIICIEDASQDKSSIIAKEYENNHENIRLIFNEKNRGLAYSRNRGVSIAEGKYIFYVDSDDMIKPGCLKKLFDLAEENTLENIFFDTDMIYEENYGVDTYKPIRSGRYNGVYDGPSLFTEFEENGDYDPVVWRQFWSLEFLKQNKIDFINGIFHEDNPYTFESILKLKRCMCINESCYVYRRRNNSITGKKMSEKRMADRLIGMAAMLKIWQNGHFDLKTGKAINHYMSRSYEYNEQLIVANDIDIEKVIPYIEGTCAEWLLHKKKSLLKIAFEDFVPILSDKYLIYGAGLAARKVIEYFDEKDIPICGIAVTSTQDNVKSIYGHRVKNIYDYPFDQDVYVVIAIKNIKVQKEIKELLNRLGYNKIIVIK